MIVRERFRGLFQKYLLVLFLAVGFRSRLTALSKPGLAIATSEQGLISCLAFKQHLPQPKSMTSFTVSQTSSAGWSRSPGATSPTSGGGPKRCACFGRRRHRQPDTPRPQSAWSAFMFHGSGSIELKAAPTDPLILRVVGARSTQIWFSDVSYHRGSEPLPDGRDRRQSSLGRRRHRRSQSQADLGRDLCDQSGKTGFAFVLDRPGRLIAHPDISLVLRGAERRRPSRSAPYATRSALRGGLRDEPGCARP